MGQLTGEWKKVDGVWFQKEIVKRWVRYVELQCCICSNMFKTRHCESVTCSEKCRALFRWKKTPAEKRWKVKDGSLHNGYRMIHVSGKSRQVPEHRHIAEIKAGRKLKRSEHVHHVNGDRLDNRPENLVVITQADHNTLHKSIESKKRNKIGRFMH